MSEVIDLAARREAKRREGWISGPAVCLQCAHEWVAVRPEGTLGMECPECHTFKGVNKGLVFIDDKHWTCGCGNDLLRIAGGRAYCPLCGREWPCHLGD